MYAFLGITAVIALMFVAGLIAGVYLTDNRWKNAAQGYQDWTPEEPVKYVYCDDELFTVRRLRRCVKPADEPTMFTSQTKEKSDD